MNSSAQFALVFTSRQKVFFFHASVFCVCFGCAERGDTNEEQKNTSEERHERETEARQMKEVM
jgi:hypothetical protein